MKKAIINPVVLDEYSDACSQKEAYQGLNDALARDGVIKTISEHHMKFSGQEAPECDETLLFNRNVQPDISII